MNRIAARRGAVGAMAAAALLASGGCAAIPYLGWSKPEQQRYFELAAVCQPDELKKYAALPDQAAREEYWRTFWKKKDPTPTTERNERYEEHLARVETADGSFPSSNFRWDDRGKFYVKYGEPQDREVHPLGNAPGEFEMGGDYSGEHTGRILPTRGWERWTYSGMGRQFIFVQSDVGYRLVNSLMAASSFMDVPTHKTFELAAVDRTELQQLPNDAYRHQYGQPLDFPFGVSRFGDSLGADIWVYYSVPLDMLDYDSSGSALLNRRVVVFDRQMREALRDDKVLTPPDVGRMIPDAQAIDVVRFRLAPGDYTLAISLEDALARKTGIYEYRFPVLDYLAGAKQASDLLLAREIMRDTSGAKFRKGDYRIVPQPSYAFRKGAKLYLYYEIYHLKTDSDGRYRTEVRYYLVSQKDKTARGTAPAVLTTERPRLEQAVALSLEGLPEGGYHAVVTARDQASGKERTLITPFTITQ